MEIKVENCCGLDVHQKTVVACVLKGSLISLKSQKVTRTFGTRTFELHELGKWLLEQEVERVIMESTGQYWCPVWNILEKYQLNLIVANPQRIKGIPGRKTDQKDSEWIADLGRMGLVSSSYIPSKEIQDLRSLTRTRAALMTERTQHKNRIHNILQHANIKLTSYLSDIYGVTGKKLLHLLINGEIINEAAVTPILNGRIRASIHDIVQAMDGELSKVQRKELNVHFTIIDVLEEQMSELTLSIEEITSHYSDIFTRLQSIPGVSKNGAAVILVEVGPDVESFKTVKHLASWAGMCPGSYESGGVRKSAHVTQGNKYLKTALYHAGRTAGHSNSQNFSVFFNRIANRGSRQKAVIATGHKILRIIYKLLSTDMLFYDENGDNKKGSLATYNS